MTRLALILTLILCLWPLSLAAEGPDTGEEKPTPTLPAASDVTPTVPRATVGVPAPTTPALPTPTPGPLDLFEPDDVPQQAGRIVIGELQLRTYWNGTGNDVDWAVVYLKPGRWQIAARTATPSYDPRLTVEGQVADDTGTSKDAILDFTATDERDYLILVENLGLDGPGAYTLSVARLGDLFTPTPYPTYTPLPTYTPVPPTPVIYPTYTPYPTLPPYPTPVTDPTWPPHTGSLPPPYPTYVVPQVPPQMVGTGYGHGPVAPTGGTGDRPDPDPAPLPPAPQAARVSLQIYIDANRNGVMDYGEEAENLLVYATTRDRSFEIEGYTRAGEAVLPLSGLAEDEELLLLVPYLHRAASFQQKGGTITSDVALDLPTYPVYLP